jgi:hypothetical protein
LLEEILENAQATGEAAFSLSTSIIDIDTIHDSNIDPQLLQIDTQCKASAPGSITSTISQASSRLHTPMPYKRSNKSRLRPESEDRDSDTKRARTKPDIGLAIKGMTEELRLAREAKQALADRKTFAERAIDILYQDYKNRMDSDAIITAIEVFETEHKARSFISLKADEKRDLWLERATSCCLNPNDTF